MSRELVSRVERGCVRGIPLGTLERIAAALGGTIDVTLRWQGADLDRLLDAGHARLVELVAGFLDSCGWETRTEVSFNHFGDRGRVDVLAFHPSSRRLLIVEAKTEIGDLQELVGRLDVKTRLAPVIGPSVGWPRDLPVLPVVVIRDSRRSRSVVKDHPRTFARFSTRGRQATAWVRCPDSGLPTGLLWFVSVPDSHGAIVRRAGRVRTVRSPP